MRLGIRALFARPKYCLIVLVAIAAGVCAWDITFRDGTALPRLLPSPSPVATKSSFFAQSFPASPKFQQELDLLRQSGRLQANDESLINDTIASSSELLAMPPAILWCLLFQESRLNHLEGLRGDQGARGLGQFSYFSFYEVNHHLDRFGPMNVKLMNQVLGKDIRPVQPLEVNVNSPSSYFHIPTAVVTSAAFLNNRYLQLQRILSRNGVKYEPDLLWYFASMAYNKGTRSVVSFWNDTRRRGGKARLEKMVSQPDVLFAGVTDVALLTRSLRKIWSGSTASRYARELDVHMENLKACSARNGGNP